MKKWPLPNLNRDLIFINNDLNRFDGREPNWYYEGKKDYFYNSPSLSDLPKGWSNPWPDLPIPDEENTELWLNKISLSSTKNRCYRESL